MWERLICFISICLCVKNRDKIRMWFAYLSIKTGSKGRFWLALPKVKKTHQPPTLKLTNKHVVFCLFNPWTNRNVKNNKLWFQGELLTWTTYCQTTARHSATVCSFLQSLWGWYNHVHTEPKAKPVLFDHTISANLHYSWKHSTEILVGRINCGSKNSSSMLLPLKLQTLNPTCLLLCTVNKWATDYNNNKLITELWTLPD